MGYYKDDKCGGECQSDEEYLRKCVDAPKDDYGNKCYKCKKAKRHRSCCIINYVNKHIPNPECKNDVSKWDCAGYDTASTSVEWENRGCELIERCGSPWFNFSATGKQIRVSDEDQQEALESGTVPTTDVGVGDQSIAVRDQWYACLVKAADGSCKLVAQRYPCEEDLTVDDCEKIETIGETCSATCADECAKMESSTMHVVKYYCENDKCECKLEPKYAPGQAGGAGAGGAEKKTTKCTGSCSWTPCGTGYENLGQLDCYNGQYCCVPACVGNIKMTFVKTAYKPGEKIEYVISGLANCDGKTVWIYMNDILYGNCTMTDGTCTGTLDKTIGLAGDYEFTAEIDKNHDDDTLDDGESTTVTLKIAEEGGKAKGAEETEITGGTEENFFSMLVRLFKTVFG